MCGGIRPNSYMIWICNDPWAVWSCLAPMLEWGGCKPHAWLHRLSGSRAWWWWWIFNFSLVVIMPIVGDKFKVDLESELKQLFLLEN